MTGAVTGVLLAAGRGTRYDRSGREDKLLADAAGLPVVVRACRALRTVVETVLVVVRDDLRGSAVAGALSGEDARVLRCADAGLGMGHSLALAAATLLEEDASRAMVVALGDMPGVAPDTVRRLVAALPGPTGIVAPWHRDTRGHPVLFGAAHLPALARCEGDRGAAALLARHPVTRVDVDDPGVLQDVDSPADLRTLMTADRWPDERT